MMPRRTTSTRRSWAFPASAEHELRRVRLDQQPLGAVDLREWSGILLGGGPFNYTDRTS